MLLEKIKKFQIILGSQSPRRQLLVKELGIDFTIKIHNEEEIFPENMPFEDIPVFLAMKKAQLFENDLEDNSVLITADTIVALEGEIINKPIDYNDAFSILNKLSGKKHTVVTGVCIKSRFKQITFNDLTHVYFKKISHSDIKYYLDFYKPYDKAGAYGIQEWIGYIGIEKIEGSYPNVMGLPVHKLYEELSKFIDN